jgi:hypothetical protein
MLGQLRDIVRNLPVENPDAALEQIARRVVQEKLAPAAIVMLESARPVSFIASQAVIMTTPFVGGFIEPLHLERYATLFGDRAFIERLISRIEELESERTDPAGPAPPPGELPSQQS